MQYTHAHRERHKYKCSHTYEYKDYTDLGLHIIMIKNYIGEIEFKGYNNEIKHHKRAFSIYT